MSVAAARDHTVTDSGLNGFVGTGVGKDYNRGAERNSVELKLSPLVTDIVLLAIALLTFAVSGCGDDASKPDDSLSSPSPSAQVQADTSTPASPDRPALNVQFIGAADLSDESKLSLADLIESIQAGVVQITTSRGSGSGFIITPDGLVVTNAHVVSGESSVGVWLTNGRRYDADVLERDSTSDLALLRIDGGGFQAFAVGDSDRVRMGDEVLALGFPLADTIGTNLTVTRGIVSSTRVEDGIQLLQTDASLNPGNSGGPLVNRDGEVIGVNASRIEETDSGRPVSNIGFAISVSELERRLPTLGGQIASPNTPTPAPTPIPASDPTWTPAPTFTPEPSWTPAPTFTPEPTSTPTLTPTPTPMTTPTSTPTFTPTPTPTPTPPFVSVSSGSDHACGLRSDGSVVCRAGMNYDPRDSSYHRVSVSSNERFESISTSNTHTCGLREDGVAVCWGNVYDLLYPYSFLKDEHFTDISIGRYHNCGLREEEVRTPYQVIDGKLWYTIDIIEIAVCWGSDDEGWAPPSQAGRFMSISTGWQSICALREDGIADCWGLDQELADLSSESWSLPEDERFISISYPCGLREDGVVLCFAGPSPPQDERFISISYPCGLREDGVAVCWSRAATPPKDERFISISNGRSHGCGLREDNSIVCWGDGPWDQFSPGDERFISVSSGYWHMCGVREDGIIICWGDLDWDESLPP